MKKIFIILIAAISCKGINAQSVGIGTTTPNSSAQLDITSITKGLLLPRMTTLQRTAIMNPVAGLLVYDMDFKENYYYDGTAWRKLLNNTFWNSASSRNWIYNNTDSIGIGTAVPIEKLHVKNGNIYVDDNRSNQNPNVIFDVPAVNGNEAGLQFKRTGDTLASIAYVENTGVANYIRIGLQNAGTRNDFTVNTNGEIGVGTLNPLGQMQLSGYTGDNLVISDADGTIQFSQPIVGTPVKKGFIQLSGDDVRIGTNSGNLNGRFVIRTNGANRLYVDETGNVSIGTVNTAAGYKLHVGGKAICEELKVQLIANWPDYVFEKKYTLTPLNDLKNYIETNKHLPGIPSAPEVEKNGIEVGDMQKKLLQKVEELTLYIVQLKEEIDLLKTKIN